MEGVAEALVEGEVEVPRSLGADDPAGLPRGPAEVDGEGAAAGGDRLRGPLRLHPQPRPPLLGVYHGLEAGVCGPMSASTNLLLNLASTVGRVLSERSQLINNLVELGRLAETQE